MKITEGELDKLSKSLAQVRLTHEEKQGMLSSIYEAAALPENTVRSPFLSVSMFTSHRLVATFATFMFVVVGTGYAAAGSLPGEMLYGLKVNVMEPLALKMAFSEEERNGYKIHLLHTRVEEMRELQLQAGIDVYAEEASHYATERNVVDLEASAIFNEAGENTEVSAEIEVYNSLISEPYRIETKLLKNKILDVSEVLPTAADEDEDEEDEEDPVKEVEETVKAAATVADEVVKDSTDKAKATVTEVEETVEEVTDVVDDVTAPIESILGL